MKLTELGFFFLRAVHKPFTLDCNRKVRPPSVDRPSEALYTAYIHAGKNGRFWPSSVSVDVYRKYVSKNYQWTCHERWKLLSLRPYVHARAAKTALSDLYLLTLKLIRNILPIIINTLVHWNLWACSYSNFLFFGMARVWTGVDRESYRLISPLIYPPQHYIYLVRFPRTVIVWVLCGDLKAFLRRI